jgi:hypothetical protein
MNKKRVIKSHYYCECDVCGKNFTAKYSNTRYCSNACKQKAYRIGYSEKKTRENTIELQLLTQKNKETELQNEKLRLELTIQQNEIRRNTQKLQLIDEEKERVRQEEEQKLKRQKEFDEWETKTNIRNDANTKIINSILNRLIK